MALVFVRRFRLLVALSVQTNTAMGPLQIFALLQQPLDEVRLKTCSMHDAVGGHFGFFIQLRHGQQIMPVFQYALYPPRRCCAVSIFPHIHGVRNARPDVSGTFIFAFAAPAVNDSELDKRCVLCYTENATNPMIIAGDHYAPENSN